MNIFLAHLMLTITHQQVPVVQTSWQSVRACIHNSGNVQAIHVCSLTNNQRLPWILIAVFQTWIMKCIYMHQHLNSKSICAWTKCQEYSDRNVKKMSEILLIINTVRLTLNNRKVIWNGNDFLQCYIIASDCHSSMGEHK